MMQEKKSHLYTIFYWVLEGEERGGDDGGGGRGEEGGGGGERRLYVF